MSPYLIAYEDKAGKPLENAVVTAWSHWDACEIAWLKAPRRAGDFQVYNEEQYLWMKKRAFPASARRIRGIKGGVPRVKGKRANVWA